MTTPDKLYEKALKLSYREPTNWSRVHKLLEESAKQGEARATYALGTWYLHGRYFERDVKKGVRMIAAAAKEGVPDALFDLAVSYERGTGVPQNTALALETYLRAALAGDKQAWKSVGSFFSQGVVVKQNRRLAKVFREASKTA